MYNERLLSYIVIVINIWYYKLSNNDYNLYYDYYTLNNANYNIYYY